MLVFDMFEDFCYEMASRFSGKEFKMHCCIVTRLDLPYGTTLGLKEGESIKMQGQILSGILMATTNLYDGVL